MKYRKIENSESWYKYTMPRAKAQEADAGARGEIQKKKNRRK
jgi:hypothetical protein